MRLLLTVFIFAFCAVETLSSGVFDSTVGYTSDPSLKEKRERFFQWCRDNGVTSEQLEWREGGVAGSGLFAKRFLNGTSTLLGTIPLNATISALSLNDIGWTEKARVGGVDVDDEPALLASYLLYEKFVDNYKGFAGPYIETLPQSFPSSACYWTDDEINFAEAGSPLLALTAFGAYLHVQEEYKLFRKFFEGSPHVWKTSHNITLDDYCWAVEMVTSRWFGVEQEKQKSAASTTAAPEKQEEEEEDENRTKGVKNVNGFLVMTQKEHDGYQGTHMVPFLDLFNHNIIMDPDRPTYFKEISSWQVTADGVFRLTLEEGGDVQKEGEVFITYGARSPDDMILHYGFCPNIPLEFFEPAVSVQPDQFDPLRELKAKRINDCWPSEHERWVKMMMRYMPLEVFQRANIIEETRIDMLKNRTFAKQHFCSVEHMFARKDIDTLRRNKRALVRVYNAMKTRNEELKAIQEEEKRVGFKYTPVMEMLKCYRDKSREVLEIAMSNFKRCSYRLIKQIHPA